jgi:amino acid transporter
MGEKQKQQPIAEPTLTRSMSPFSSFAIAMSTICILAGGVTSFHNGFCSVGGAAIGLGWPLEFLFALIVAMTMAQAASAFPTAGGAYHWSYTLGGRGWGWATAYFSLAGLVTVLAAVNVGLCRFVIGAASRVGEYDPANVYPWVQHGAVIGMTLLQAYVNHRGIRLTSRLNDLNGYLIVAVAVALTALLVACAADSGFDLGRLITFVNYSGLPPGEQEVWPRTTNIAWLFLLGMLLPAYTLTGFDAAAQTAEETIDAPRVVPRGIVRGVLMSGVAGWVFLSAVVLAMPDLDEAANAGELCFLYAIRAGRVPYWIHFPIYGGLVVAQFLCGLAVLTSASRMAFAFARDGGLPCSRWLRRISPSHHTPSIAIWTVAAAAILFGFVKYEAIAAVCAMFLYLSYVLPSALGLWAYGRTWTRMGPWHLGRWYRPLAVLSVAGCVLLFVIGVQPPNHIAIPIMGCTFLALVVLWFGYMRRHFPGPPETIRAMLRPADVPDSVSEEH